MEEVLEEVEVDSPGNEEESSTDESSNESIELTAHEEEFCMALG
jgi:hypothetical protein